VTLLVCPHCHANVRPDRLERHMLRVHPGSCALSATAPRQDPQRARAGLARPRPRTFKREFSTARCSYCGLVQKLFGEALECAQCGRADDNPVIGLDAKQITDEAKRAKAQSEQQRKMQKKQKGKRKKKRIAALAKTGAPSKKKPSRLPPPRSPCDPAKAQDDWWRLRGE
jgi:hypothetical protein